MGLGKNQFSIAWSRIQAVGAKTRDSTPWLRSPNSGAVLAAGGGIEKHLIGRQSPCRALDHFGVIWNAGKNRSVFQANQ